MAPAAFDGDPHQRCWLPAPQLGTQASSLGGGGTVSLAGRRGARSRTAGETHPQTACPHLSSGACPAEERAPFCERVTPRKGVHMPRLRAPRGDSKTVG